MVDGTFHRHCLRPDLAIVVDRERGVRHRAAAMAADHSDGKVARAFKRHANGLDAKSRDCPLVRRVVG